MSFRGVQLFIFCILLPGLFSAPFISDEEANQFIRLKRQAQGYWDPNHGQNAWGYTINEQASEYWTSLRTTAQYYMDLGSLTFDPSVSQDNIRSYMTMLQQAGAHIQQQMRRN
ncbi:uncharacterized protein C3orf85 homolog [Protopterus annectens]|uniref:uncharacterized protein C3orf85 homolog n=1 Tax=Protopterus annectens TaxID=7888 RepID=UPI001CF94D1A|nr:uncharacterized protein C3orf85 homolog [Protopterus annectens]